MLQSHVIVSKQSGEFWFKFLGDLRGKWIVWVFSKDSWGWNALSSQGESWAPSPLQLRVQHGKPNRLRLKLVGEVTLFSLLLGFFSSLRREVSFISPSSLQLCALLLSGPGRVSASPCFQGLSWLPFLSLDCAPWDNVFPQADVCLRGDTQYLNYQGVFLTSQVFASELWGGPGPSLAEPSLCTPSRVCFPATVSAGDPNRYQALALTIITSLPSCLTLLPPLCRGLKRKLNYNRCSLLLPKGRADVEMADLGRWRLWEGTEKQESGLYFR